MMGGYNRRVSRKKALRKQKIAKKLYGGERFDNLHQYSKNKVHCSCPMCSRKTNNKGKKRLKHGNYYPSKDWKHSDAQKIESAEQELQEYESG